MPVDAVALSLSSLPAVLAGPVVRRLTRTSVCVWVALSRPEAVTLHVQERGGAGPEVATVGAPVQVGLHLHLLAITSPAPSGQFAAHKTYAYRLSSPGWPAEPNWADLAFGGDALPAFSGLPDRVEDLVVLHVSCRKWAGGGVDVLSVATDVIQERVSGPSGSPNGRPHLLIHSGDQIYADDLATPLAFRVRRVAADLVTMDIFESTLFGDLQRVAGRQEICTDAGLTSSAARDHLWTLGEFYAAYLLAWSDVLWPATLPAWADAEPEIDHRAGLTATDWNELVGRLSLFRAGLPKVRKVLANVPSLMVLDDHEITDDWNLNDAWADAVYNDSVGRRIVANGLLAFNLFQHWGNVPDRYATPGTAESQVLAAATFSQVVPDEDERLQAQEDLERNLGLPVAIEPAPSVLRDISAPGAMRYDFTLGQAGGYPVRIVALDERTAREFPSDDHPAARISLAALPAMVPTTPAPLTIVVAPSALFGTHLIEHVLQPAAGLVASGANFTDYESWPAATAQHQELLRLLAAIAPIVVLSGDVHYGAVAKATMTIGGSTSHFAQLTCSPAKNADGMTMTLHQLGDLATMIGIERPRAFAVFETLEDVRSIFNNIPALPATLPYDDLTDVTIGRVRRAAQESPAVMSADVAAAYGLTPDRSYEFTPVDDESMPAPGPLLDAMQAAPAPWPGWDPARSHTMLQALRARDLHRIGRVLPGLPQIAQLEFTSTPLTVHQRLRCPVGEQADAAPVVEVVTQVALA